MIVREDGDSLVLVRQTDHAMLSGWLAAAWGAAPWSAPAPRDSCVAAARLHDLPWASFDETLPCRPDGRPYSFHEVPRAITTGLYGRGIDAVESIDPYAGLLASLHFTGLLTGRWEPVSEEGRLISAFVAGEAARQERLRAQLAIDEARDRELMRAYFWLQLWDRISLDICRYGFTGWTGQYQPAPVGVEPNAALARLRVALEPDGVCRLDPYPLVVRPYRARVPAVRVPMDALRDPAQLRAAWLAGGADGIEVTFLPG